MTRPVKLGHTYVSMVVPPEGDGPHAWTEHPAASGTSSMVDAYRWLSVREWDAYEGTVVLISAVPEEGRAGIASALATGACAHARAGANVLQEVGTGVAIVASALVAGRGMCDRNGCSQQCGDDALKHVCRASRHPCAGREVGDKALGADFDGSAPMAQCLRIGGASDTVCISVANVAATAGCGVRDNDRVPPLPDPRCGCGNLLWLVRQPPD